ncbi:UNVERIFIED_CONTAM: hypothetical protein Slati_4218900 [Sesamum latifolium]|uniref:Reverse transcriptase Ty1/copia-type domain-containing protein n=1 Tax=Sesamum latifolium TaxID=2727402 RepID=A0AAW2TAD7_9LAMI
MQCSWKRVFQRIADGMRSCLMSQAKNLNMIMLHHLNLQFPLMVFQVLSRSTRGSRPPERYEFMGLTSQLDNDPKTYGEAMLDIDSDKWFEAMRSEMDSIGSNQVWTLVDLPKGVGPVGCKWVYKPMAKSIRILLAIAAWYDYEIWHMDVKMAFLNGFVEEEIYMDQSRVFTTIGEEQKVLGDIKAWLSTQFSMKNMGDASYILGIKIYRDRSRRILGLTQYSYIEKADVAYALSVTGRYQACAGEAHWSAVKTILKYLKRIKDMFLIYGGGELILEVYNDASFSVGR